MTRILKYYDTGTEQWVPFLGVTPPPPETGDYLLRAIDGEYIWTPTVPPAPSIVAGVAGADTSSNSTFSINAPGTIQPGDVGVLCSVYSRSGNLTFPSGWTRIGSELQYGGSAGASVHYRVLTGDEDQIEIGSDLSGRMALGLLVVRGVDAPSTIEVNVAGASSDTVSSPSITEVSSDPAMVVSGWAERSSAPAVGFNSTPDNLGTVYSAFGVGNGSSSVGIAGTSSPITDWTSPFSPGDWEADVPGTNAATMTWSVTLPVSEGFG